MNQLHKKKSLHSPQSPQHSQTLPCTTTSRTNDLSASQSIFRAFPRPPSPLLRSLFTSRSRTEITPRPNNEITSDDLAHSILSPEGASLDALDRFFGNSSSTTLSLDTSQVAAANPGETVESPDAYSSSIQDTLRYSSASGGIYEFPSTPDDPEAPGDWFEHLMEVEDWTPRQSMESSTITPHTIAGYSGGESYHNQHGDIEMLTESGGHHFYQPTPALVSPQMPSNPPPMPAPHENFRHPNPNAYYSEARSQSRQAILANLAYPTTAPVLIPSPPRKEWEEPVLVEVAKDKQGIRLFEIISIPGYLLRPQRLIICYGALTGSWTILRAVQLQEGYVYLRCYYSPLDEYAYIRIPCHFYLIQESEWDQLHVSYLEGSL
ncbi:hypothetical protein FB451DRAFT_1161883 [Mycena latifolia]|nr:hypothetical protein FB451DRAFT_1161883 [Mycena latifolia]